LIDECQPLVDFDKALNAMQVDLKVDRNSPDIEMSDSKLGGSNTRGVGESYDAMQLDFDARITRLSEVILYMV
jgi:hypothetical protein